MTSSGFAVAAKSIHGLHMVTFRTTQPEAEAAMRDSTDKRALCVMPAEVRYAANGNIRRWDVKGAPVAERERVEIIIPPTLAGRLALDQTDDGLRVGVIADGYFITEPYFGIGLTEKVEPGEYGLTVEEADFIVALNAKLGAWPGIAKAVGDELGRGVEEQSA